MSLFTLTIKNVEFNRNQLALIWDYFNFKVVITLERISRMLHLLSSLNKEFYGTFHALFCRLALTEEMSRVRVVQWGSGTDQHTYYSLLFPTIRDRLFPSHPWYLNRDYYQVKDKLWLHCSSTELHDCPISDRSDYIPAWYDRNMQTRFDIEHDYYNQDRPQVRVNTAIEAWDLSKGTMRPIIPQWMKPYNPYDHIGHPVLNDAIPLDDVEQHEDLGKRLLHPEYASGRSSKFTRRAHFQSLTPGFDGGAWDQMPYTEEVHLDVPNYMLMRFFDTLKVYPRVKRLSIQSHCFFNQHPALTRSTFTQLRDGIQRVLPGLRCIMLDAPIDYYRVPLFQARVVGQEIFGLMWHHPRVNPDVPPHDFFAPEEPLALEEPPVFEEEGEIVI